MEDAAVDGRQVSLTRGKCNWNADGFAIHDFATQESVDYMYQLPFLSNDVFICTYAKSGTTWMQQICLQLLHGPLEDFTDIGEESPWIETRLNLSFQPKRYPRIFKTHLPFELVPRRRGASTECRYIFIDREVKDLVASFYKHLHDFGAPVAADLDTFVGAFTKGHMPQGPYDTFLHGWKTNAPQELGSRVLITSFEKMKKDLEGTIREVAAFLQVDLTESLLAETKRMSTFDYMQKYSDKFSLPRERLLSQHLRGVFNKKETAAKESEGEKEKFVFIRAGTVGGYANVLGPQHIELLQHYADTRL